MPIDAYTLCPCGTGKKVKFCCPDLLGELQKIERMLEGEQNLACLNHIELLRQKQPFRACLLSIKGMVLRATDRWEEAAANAATFVEKHPHNPTALAESAIATAAQQGGRPAVDVLQKALAACNGKVSSRVYEAMGVVAQVLLSEGQWMAGRGLVRLQLAIDDQDQQPLQMLVELNRSTDVPLLLKDDLILESCPDDVSWKGRFDEAVAPATLGNWLAAAEKLTTLAEEVQDSPTIWRSLAALRGWLADTDGCIEALRRLAATGIPQEDAVEAEALALLIADTPLGDALEVLSAVWTVQDVAHLQAALALDPRVAEIPLDPSSWDEADSPPPRAGYLILDHPIREKAEDLTLDDVSLLLGRALLYGRQTDREARLEIGGVTPEDLQQIKEMLGQIAGEALDADQVEERTIGQTSATARLLQRTWRPPKEATAKQLDRLATAYLRDTLLNRWPQLRLGIFDGRSAREVAADESYRVKLPAAVLVLQSWDELGAASFDFNELRSQLGLPVLGPIDPESVEIGSLPLVRLSRVDAEKASDEAVCEGYRRGAAFGATAASERFARVIVDRSSLAGSPEQLGSYRTLASAERDPEKALDYIQRGRTAAESAGLSSASWDLMELTFRFARRQADHLGRLVEHIQTCHIEEPGVAEALTAFLVEAGVLHPDGTLTAVPPPGQPLPTAEAEGEPDPHQRLWTPESQQPAGEKKTIWTPD